MDSMLDSRSSIATKRSKYPLPTKFCAISVSLGIFVLLYTYFVWSRGDSGRLDPQHAVEKAVAILAGPSNVTGTVHFFQPGGRGPVTLSGKINNLDPNALRGFHIHQAGDLTNGCLSTGSHYNPLGKTHGAPADTDRHVGDLGNVKSDDKGVARIALEDGQISLNGPLSILGRGVMVHAGTDDLGRGGNEESHKTGNAGARVACGVIGIRT